MSRIVHFGLGNFHRASDPGTVGTGLNMTGIVISNQDL